MSALTGRGAGFGSAPGEVLFARYAYPPNALGYCGPADPVTLLAAGDEPGDAGRACLGHLAASFEGAWPYLQLIAGHNGIVDPLDPRVVEAYWVGNELLDRVPAPALAAWLSRLIAREAAHEPTASAPPVAARCAVAQHGIHVFAVYPWLGLLRGGRQEPALEVLDRCRIRWGRVEALAGDLVTVTSQALCFDGSRLLLGSEREEQAKCGPDWAGFGLELRRGDTVSLHWDWVCDRLSPLASARLQECTRRNLAAVNG